MSVVGVRGGLLLGAGALAVLLASAVPSDAGTEALQTLAPHRAVYEMAIGKRLDASEVMTVEGRLVYEFTGSKCEGWTSRFRLVTRLNVAVPGPGDKAEGVSRLTDLRTTAFEDAEGKSFDFLNQNLVDERMVEDSKGVATHGDGRTTVRLDRPAPKSFDLPATVKFPTEHLAAIVGAAMAGQTFTEIDLFDGSETGEKVYHTTVVIGREQTGPDDFSDEPAAKAAGALLEGKRRWPVEVSYFDPQRKALGEPTPDYQMSFLLYENGVSRKMKLDYGEFSLVGTLSSLEAMPAAACK